MQKLKLFLRFYGNFAFLSIIITYASWSILDYWKMLSLIAPLLILKLLSLLIAYYWVQERKYKEHYFYYNLGISTSQLWLTTFTFDLLVFLLMLIYKCSHL